MFIIAKFALFPFIDVARFVSEYKPKKKKKKKKKNTKKRKINGLATILHLLQFY
jgi:hypothetical protein